MQEISKWDLHVDAWNNNETREKRKLVIYLFAATMPY